MCHLCFRALAGWLGAVCSDQGGGDHLPPANRADHARGHAATILGIVWTAIGASTLLVALFSGAAVQLVAQLPDEVRFLVGCVRGISLCTVVAGIVVFVVTMLIILSLPGGEDSDGDEADTA